MAYDALTQQSVSSSGGPEMNVLTNEITAEACWAALLVIFREQNISQDTWEDMDHWRHEAFAAMVRMARMGETAERLHKYFCKELSNNGWTFCEQRSVERRETPLLVTWELLRPEHQAIFRRWQGMVLGLTLEY